MSNIQYRLLRTGTGYHGSPTSVSTSGRYFYLVLTTRLPEKVNIRMSTSSTWWNQSCISAPLLEHLLSGECGLWTMPAGSPLPPQKDSMFCPVNWQKDCMSGNVLKVIRWPRRRKSPNRTWVRYLKKWLKDQVFIMVLCSLLGPTSFYPTAVS